jgi:hypothetical protein
MEQHYSDARRGKKRPFYSALRKYGNKVKWEIINIYYTKSYVQNREKFYISLYQSNNLLFGYNSTLGGEGTPGLQFSKTKYIDNSGVIYFGTKDVFKKTGVTKSSLTQSIKNNYWCKNIYFSIYKEGMLVAEPRLSKPKHERKRKIVCNKNGICFFSLRNAADFIGVQEQSILRVVKGRRLSVKGYEFKYITGGGLSQF